MARAVQRAATRGTRDFRDLSYRLLIYFQCLKLHAFEAATKSTFAMPAAVVQPQAKTALADSTNIRGNAIQQQPSGVKRRHDGSAVKSSPYSAGTKTPHTLSSQNKSHFEEEVLEKLTQDINGLKRSNAEKDQQWKRPPLEHFDPQSDNLCFQQIEAEEGTLRGGKTTVKLFGTTEVRIRLINLSWRLNN